MKKRGQEVIEMKERLMRKVVIDPETGCWIWTGPAETERCRQANPIRNYEITQ